MAELETKTVAEFYLTARGKYELFSLLVWENGNAGCRTYDVDISKQYGYVFHCSGGGHGAPVKLAGIYWASHDGLVKEKSCTLLDKASQKRNTTRRLKTIPRHLRESNGDLLNWLNYNAIHESTEYCNVCRDYIPTDSDNPCPHIWWCHELGTWSTPDERLDCQCEDCKVGA